VRYKIAVWRAAVSKELSMAKKVEEGKMDLVVTKPSAGGMSEYMSELAGMAGAGLEEATAKDMAMPFFKLLQSLSPEVRRSEPQYIEGAQEGQWCDTIARETYDKIVFVPCKFVTHYLEWHTRKDGGGLVKNHGTDQSILKTCVQDPDTFRSVTRDGTEVIATGTWFGLVIQAERDKQVLPMLKRAVIALSGTQQKASRRWVSDVGSISMTDPKTGKIFTPPIFAMSYLLGGAPTKNDQGSWFLATVDRAGWTLDYPNGRSIFDKAIEFNELANDLKPENLVQEDNSGPQAGGGARPRTSNKVELDDDIPF
jgi:hypothetical protein